MKQKLTRVIENCATASAVYPVKSKLATWRKASQKAWAVRKRQKAARAAQSAPETAEQGKAA